MGKGFYCGGFIGSGVGIGVDGGIDNGLWYFVSLGFLSGLLKSGVRVFNIVVCLGGFKFFVFILLIVYVVGLWRLVLMLRIL